MDHFGAEAFLRRAGSKSTSGAVYMGVRGISELVWSGCGTSS